MHLTNNSNNSFYLTFKLTEHSMITNILWTDGHKLLQESN